MNSLGISGIERISINLLELKALEDLKYVYEFYNSFLKRFFNEEGRPLEEFFVFVSCPVCGLSTGKHKVTLDNFVYEQCDNCRSIYNNPRLRTEVIDEMYASGEYKIYFRKLVLKSQSLRKDVIDVRKYKQVDSFFERPGTILDVGCGSGSFLKVCEEHGWNVYGIEPSQSACSVARQMYGLDLAPVTFEAFPTEAKFDCIAFWGLEHLSDPLRALLKAESLLDRRGLIVFEGPSADSYLMKYVCENEFSPYRFIEHARHVLFFSKESIANVLCKAANLEVAYLETNGLDLQSILLCDVDGELTSKIMAMQQIIDELLLGDHYRVFLKKST